MDTKFSISHRKPGASSSGRSPETTAAATTAGSKVRTKRQSQSFLRKWMNANKRTRPRNDFSRNQRQSGGEWRLFKVVVFFFMTFVGALLCMVVVSSRPTQMVRRLGSRRGLNGSRTTVNIDFPDVSIVRNDGTKTSLVYPDKLRHMDALKTTLPDFGGLVIRIPEESSKRLEPRVIQHSFQHDLAYRNLVNGPNDDDSVEGYYAFDDDNERNPLLLWDDPDIAKQKRCRRTSWHRSLYMNCNTFHEYDTMSQFRADGLKYVSERSYRAVYVDRERGIVMKQYVYSRHFHYHAYEYMRMDALVNERLSWSPRIIDIYGFCGLSVINEAASKDLESIAVPGDGRPSDSNDVQMMDNRNGLSGTQKLEYALDMFEAVSLLHSYPGGVMVHDDIQLSQFLVVDGRLKLNDFNRAEIMLFNEKDEEYCRYRNDPGRGDCRAPEEYFDYPLNEKIDVWSLGNNMYSLLTGLFPFHTVPSTTKIQKKIKAGETAEIDPKYLNQTFAEKQLAEIIPLCWTYNADERPDIFTIRALLRQAVLENRQLGKQKLS